MGRIARVTEDLGPDAGGFYVEPPDIPDGMTCHEWRHLRSPALDWRALVPRPRAIRVPALRTALS